MRTTRRLVAVIAAVGLVLAACSDDDDGDSADTEATTATEETTAATEAPGTTGATEENTGESTAETTAETTADTTATTDGEEEAPTDVDPEGVIRLGFDLEAASRGGFKWDPSANISTGVETGVYQWLYGSLLRLTSDGDLVPDLAESAEVVDPNTISITLRDGLTLSDGTPVDATMVKTVLDANLAKVANPAFRTGFYSLQSVDVVSPTELTLHIPDGSAAVWYDQYLTGVETLIVPPGTDFENPVGAGPFTMTEWTPGQTMSLVKNPTYWDADSILVGGIDMINVPPANDQAAVSALNAEQVDWVRLVPAILDAAGDNTEVVSTADPLQLMQALICKSNAPVDSVEFRQAMNYAIDRELIIEALLGGNGVPAWDLWPEGHALHNPELTEHYAFNQERARELITESGVTDPSISIIPIPAAGGPETAAVIQQQLGDVGINVEVIPTTNFVEDFLINQGGDLGLVPRSVGSRNKLDNFSGPGAGNACQYSDPELDALVQQIRLVSDASDEGQQLWYDIQDIVVGDALSLFVMFQESVYGILPARVGGYELQLAGALPVPDMWTTYIKSS